MVDQLMSIERIPQRRLRTEQTTNEAKKTALELLKTKIETLNSRASDFTTSSLFNAKSTAISDETLSITSTASTAAAAGKYDINVSQLATASKRFGSSDVGGTMGDENTVITNLHLATDITAGTFQVNGQDITVASTDTLQEVFDAISAATSGVVTASYDDITDKITLTSASGQLELGSEEDSSNFLSALKLDQLEVVAAGGGSSAVVSKSALGVVDLDVAIATSGITGPITGSDTLYINGVAIDFDADTDSMQSLMASVNDSAAGVTMSYDTTNDQFRIVNNDTGAYQMPVIDSSNGLLAAIGLTGSAGVGDDLLFSVDGGSALSSRSNVIGSDEHGITGLSVTAAETGTQTITISRDSSELKEKIDSFISAYNDVQDYIQEKTKVEATDDKVTAGDLAGNREISTSIPSCGVSHSGRSTACLATFFAWSTWA